jgi:DNA-binding NarL/FixJ family response regulator
MLTGAGSETTSSACWRLRAGAAGFLSKDLEIEALPRAIEGLRHGQAAISRKLTLSLIERLRETPSGSSGLRPVKSPLTAREWEVIDLLKSPRPPTRSRTSSCSRPRPIRSHVKNILRKLKVRSRAQAIAMADEMRKAARARRARSPRTNCAWNTPPGRT